MVLTMHNLCRRCQHANCLQLIVKPTSHYTNIYIPERYHWTTLLGIPVWHTFHLMLTMGSSADMTLDYPHATTTTQTVDRTCTSKPLQHNMQHIIAKYGSHINARQTASALNISIKSDHQIVAFFCTNLAVSPTAIHKSMLNMDSLKFCKRQV